MSLQRMRLRTAFVRALKNGESGPWPTIAQDRVFDTKIGEIQEQSEDQMLPFIAVYTDNDQRAQMATGSQMPVFKRTIDVVIELAIGAWTKGDEAAGSTEPVFSPVQTDADLEALLDLFEWQIWRALFNPENAHAASVAKLVKEFVGWDSLPGRSPRGNNKISARQITISCRVTDDWMPSQGECGEAPSVASLFPPYLHPLVRDIEKYPALRSLKEQLSGFTNPSDNGGTSPGPGITFGVEVDFVDPVVDRSLLPEGQSQGPDGRIEIAADWRTPENDS